MKQFEQWLTTLQKAQETLQAGQRLSSKQIARFIRDHLAAWNSMHSLMSPNDVEVDRMMHQLVEKRQHLGWLLRMALALLVLQFLHVGQKHNRRNRTTYTALKQGDSRWLSASDANFVVTHLVNDLMYESDIPIDIRLYLFHRIVELTEWLFPLSLRYQNVEIKPEKMVRLTQGEMWLRIAQRQRRYYGGANPVWRKGTFEYALLHDRSFRRQLQLNNPLVEAILTEWSWLEGVRRFSRFQRTLQRWLNRRWRTQALQKPAAIVVRSLVINGLIWSCFAVGLWHLMG